MRKLFCVVFALMIASMSTVQVADVYGAENEIPEREVVDVYLRPDVIIKYNGEEMAFLDVNKKKVYPILYNGSTYLPVRAISALVEKPIEWENAIKSIYMGKTFKDPAGATKGNTSAAIALKDYPAKQSTTKPIVENSNYREPSLQIPSILNPTPEAIRVKAVKRPDIMFVYNFEIQNFKDVNGERIYPITYEGSSYLPIRTISNLLYEEIEWEPVTKTVTIGKVQPKGTDVVTGSAVTNAGIEQMKKIFQRQKEMYNSVSNKIVEVVAEKDVAVKENIAHSISEDYTVIGKLANFLKDVDKGNLTEDEKLILENLNEFSVSLEMYALVIENIAYMNVSGQDYSLLSDTLLYYALDSQQKMSEIKI